MLICNKCDLVNPNHKWAQATALYMKKNEIKTVMTPIKDAIQEAKSGTEDTYTYVCPNCGELNELKDILKLKGGNTNE